MNKNSLLALFLLGVLFVVYQMMHPPMPPKTSPGGTQAETQPAQSQPASESQIAESIATPLPPVQRDQFGSSLYQAEYLTWDGQIKNWQLKEYKQSSKVDAPFVKLLSEEDPGIQILFRESNFALPKVIPYQRVRQDKDHLEYEWKGSDLKINQHIRWDPESYTLHFKIVLKNESPKILETALGMRVATAQNVVEKHKLSFLKGPPNLKYPLLYQNDSVKRHTEMSKESGAVEEKGAFRWVGIEDRYFLMALVSQMTTEVNVRYGFDQKHLYSELFYPKESIPSGREIEREMKIYVGPKKLEPLESVGAGLESSVDYGWFGWVAHPILTLLKFFHQWVKNWGLAIIVLTVFIKLLLHPVNKRALDSMKAMQKLQPKMAELREKYKNDRERLNAEMMGLFRTHKVNPLGGCLPMLLQMPIYIALYKVLYNAIELYHAPFLGVYQDLSAPDPYFIAPILLGIFMVLQQRMTPLQDPSQARMMMLMPILFSAFMLFLPVGLVLYIFVNTFMTVVQQYMHKHDMGLMDLIKRNRVKSKR